MKSMTPTCNRQRLEAFLEGDLNAAEENELAVHLNECVACRQQLEAIAAEPACWSKAGELLQPHEFADEDVASCPPQRSLQVQQVLDALAPTDDPEMLGRLGGYEVSGVVGTGGMGVVLKAFDRSLDRTVAIKVLAPHLASRGAARMRFAREAKAAAAVLHPNVMAIHSVSNDGSLPYLVMPYVRGESLQRRLDREGPLPVNEVLRIGSQVAAGLAAAHSQGLVHRDIKPANILLEDGVERVAITDFGLARAVDDATMTRTGVIAGTPQFMSPEQARGESVDQRSDLFSLGSVLYAMCTGRPPFRAETSYGILRRITDTDPRPIREINPDIPAWLCAIICKLMSKQMENRFASAAEVVELLEDCLAHVQQPATMPLPKSVSQLSQLLDSANEGYQPDRVRGRFSRKPRTNALRLMVGAAFAFVAVFAGVLIVLETNKGTLRIECDADNVPIKVTQGDKVVEKLTVTKEGAAIRVAAGQYVVEIDGALDGITVEGGKLQLQRRGREVVRIVKQDRTGRDANDFLEIEILGGSDHGLRQEATAPVVPADVSAFDAMKSNDNMATGGETRLDSASTPIYGGRNPKEGFLELNPAWEIPVRRMLSEATAIGAIASGRGVHREIPPELRGDDSQKLIGLIVVLAANGSLTWEPDPKRVLLVHTDKMSSEIADSLLSAVLDRLVSGVRSGPRKVHIDGELDENDPRLLQAEADRLREFAVEHLVSDAPRFFEYARWFWELSISFQKEADLRADSQRHAGQATELRAAGKLKEAEGAELKSRDLALQATAVAAERHAEEIRRKRAQRARHDAEVLATQIDILREQEKVKEAEQLELQLETSLRNQDPDTFRMRDLYQRIIDARTKGQHELADHLETERQNLLNRLERRYPRTQK